MQLLIDIVQVIVAFALSGAVLVLIGPMFLIISALVFLTCMALLWETARQRNEITEELTSFSEFASMLTTSFVFGLIWPAIPVIFAWRGSNDAVKR